MYALQCKVVFGSRFKKYCTKKRIPKLIDDKSGYFNYVSKWSYFKMVDHQYIHRVNYSTSVHLNHTNLKVEHNIFLQ